MMHSVLFTIVLLSLMVTTVQSNCYDNWSRCTPETDWFTGILWKDCATYCSECLGRASGSCVRVYNRECSGGFQCQCNGGNVPKSDNWFVERTCDLGL